MEIFRQPIVFITGSFIGNNCWNEWKLFFESKGYKCMAPSWPHKDAPPEELRNRHPDIAIASNRLTSLTDYFAAITRTQNEKPILIGHSLGGLIAQLLLQRGLATAAVVIHSFPAPGFSLSEFSFLKSSWETMGFFTSVQKTYLMSFRKWKYAIANGMTCEMQKELYYKYAVPESKMVIRDALNGVLKIKLKIPHAPILFTSGSDDRMVPASVNYNSFKKYTRPDSITGYREFKGFNHLVFDYPAWKEEAEYILYWLDGLNKH
jgi:pimeloyl-ACP methyl ester carboxylesterase